MTSYLQVQDLYDEAGIWGFWKGVFPTLIMVSNPALQFMLYETLLKKLKQKRALNLKGADGLTAFENQNRERCWRTKLLESAEIDKTGQPRSLKDVVHHLKIRKNV